MTDAEENDLAFLAALNESVRYCDDCGRWHEVEEFILNRETGEEVCVNCNNGEQE